MTSSRRLVVLSLVAAAASCGGHDSSPPPQIASSEPLAECEAYVDAYRACFGSLGAEAHRLTEERSEGLRARFLEGARSDVTRERTRVECVTGAKQLRGACR
jgi:hypothetical protein